MNRVQKILMERDGLSDTEAKEVMAECAEALYDGNWEAIQDYLGLEDDYIFDLI